MSPEPDQSEGTGRTLVITLLIDLATPLEEAEAWSRAEFERLFAHENVSAGDYVLEVDG